MLIYWHVEKIASNRRDEQRCSPCACASFIQSALVYVNTLMLQDILGEPEWADVLTPANRRGLTPLFWSHAARTGR